MILSEEQWFLILLAVNFLFVVAYLLLRLLTSPFKTRGWSPLLKALLMLLCPLVGPGFVLLGYVSYRLIFHREVDLSDVIFGRDRIKPLMAAEEESESNLVPVEEAISIMEKDDLRGMMLHVVRGDLKSSAPAIAMALKSDDSEVSHYAAAALQRVLDEFRSSVGKNYDQVMAEKEDETAEELEARLLLAEETVDSISEFMKPRLLPEGEQRQYAGKMDEICELLFEKSPGRLTVERLEGVSMQQLAVEDFEACRKWCLRAYAAYPQSAEAYTCQLKLYFTTGEREKFFHVLDELRSSGASIDKETLDMVRVFQ